MTLAVPLSVMPDLCPAFAQGLLGVGSATLWAGLEASLLACTTAAWLGRR